MKKENKFINAINKTENLVLVTMFVVMVSVIFFQVVMRSVFNNSSTWSEELGKFIFVWISWLGISIAQRKNEHIKITMLTDRLSLKVQEYVKILANLCLTGILAVTVYYSYTLVIFQQRVPYAGIKISTSWGYLSLVLGCSFMILRVLYDIYINVKNIKNGTFKTIEAVEGGDN